jgi:hypothetical protein
MEDNQFRPQYVSAWGLNANAARQSRDIKPLNVGRDYTISSLVNNFNPKMDDFNDDYSSSSSDTSRASFND